MTKYIITEDGIDSISYDIFEYLIENPDGHPFEKLRIVIKDMIYDQIKKL